jgi:hypothetical protein
MDVVSGIVVPGRKVWAAFLSAKDAKDAKES